MNIKFRTIREMARSMFNSGESKEARREAIIFFFNGDCE